MTSTAAGSIPALTASLQPAHDRFTIWAVLAVSIVAGLVFFVRLGAEPLNDWDEAWHAQVSGEILTTGDWATLHYRGDCYFNKPPLTFWLRAIAFKVGGVNEATARFFPALFGWGSVVAATWFFARALRPGVGLLAGLILSSSWLFTIHHAGRSAETDSTLIFFLTLTVIALWQARTRPAWCYAAAIATALGWMSKGSTAYLPWITCLAAVVIERPNTGWRWRHAMGGLLLAFILTLPWQAMMLLRYGRPFAHAFYVGEAMLPALSVIEDHPGSRLFYVMIFHQYFEPWLLLAGAALLGARRRDPSWPLVIWLGCWAVVVVVACSFFATKMAWYATPALPAIAGLAAVASAGLCRRRWGWLVLMGIAVFGVIQTRRQDWFRLDQWLAASLLLAAAACLVFFPLARRRWRGFIGAILIAAPLGQQFIFAYRWIVRGEDFTGGMELRTLDEPWRELAARLNTLPHRGPIALVDQPLDPASYFYLAHLQDPPPLAALSLNEVSMPGGLRDGSIVISRIEHVDALRVMGLEEVLREGSLIVMMR